jgi:vacuolar iron transporter family protein
MEEQLRHGREFYLQEYLREFVYGGIDGAVTTFAVVAGAVGAGLEIHIILILGFANLLADGFSMSVGAYLSAKSDLETYAKHRQVEYWEVDHLPDTEREEVREIYRKKGFTGKLLDDVVQVITADKDRWVDEMMTNELQLLKEQKSPVKIGLATWVSFVVVGFIPLSLYVYDFVYSPTINLFLWTCAFTSVAFVVIGWLKSFVNQTNRWQSIGETLLLGILAAGVAYVVGDFLESLLVNWS